MADSRLFSPSFSNILSSLNSLLPKQAVDLNKPLDKRGYKGTLPTCHDFNLPTRSVKFLELIIGFSAGQIQLIDPIGHELNKLYNEEVSSIVTCSV
jgi:hypothetical protein